MKKNLKVISTFLIILFLFNGCAMKQQDKGNEKDISNEVNVNKVNEITAEKAKEMMDSREDLVVIDVREVEEYNEGHVKDSVLIPLGTIETKIGEVVEDKESTILLYCRSGRRSAEAAQILNDLGYKNIYDFGGIINWPYEIVK